jgi:hypothetical protein
MPDRFDHDLDFDSDGCLTEPDLLARPGAVLLAQALAQVAL